MNILPTNHDSENICPFLGLSSDAKTAVSYPSPLNVCHRIAPPDSPDIPHQRNYCFTEAHAQCEIFISTKIEKSEKQMIKKDHKVKRTKKSPIFFLIGILALALCTILGLVQIKLGYFSANLKPTSTLHSDMLNTSPAVQPKPTNTLIPSKTPTQIPPTQTVTQSPPHYLETPFGQDRKFIIHRLVEGESLILLASTYNTTPEAIKAINYDYRDVLWAGSVLIIPVNQTEVNGVNPMSAYLIENDGITIEKLAQDKNVSIAALCSLNALPEGYSFHSGEWVLIPH